MSQRRPSGEDNQHLVSGLCRFNSIRQARRSKFYRNHQAELTALFKDPRIYKCNSTTPRLRSFLRVVQWNIEYGTRLTGIIHLFNTHPVLRFADLILLNEVDQGMARSANANVAAALGRALSAHSVYAVEYLELRAPAKADHAERDTTALHGNAILTRHPFRNPEIVALPRCENNFKGSQKRLGRRVGLILDVDPAEGIAVTTAAVHLDVVNKPRCRQRQIRALLEALQHRLSPTGSPVLIGGDLNTHTFVRGGRLRAIRNLARVLSTDPKRLAASLLHPESREPALRELANFGYQLDGFNDRLPTQTMGGANLSDASGVPNPLKWLALKRFGPAGLTLEFRLDWIAARGLRPLGAGETIDDATGHPSVHAHTITGLTYDGYRLSDHDPIVVDVEPNKT